MPRQMRSVRKTKSWFGIGGSAHSFTVNDTDFGSGFSAGTTFTIMRVLGEYAFGPTAAPSALDVCELSVGLGLVSSDAFTLGETAAPDPLDEFGYPWLYRASHRLFFTDTGVDPSSAMASGRIAVDVKGMRKIRQDQTLAWIIQYSDLVGAPPVTLVMGSARVLLAN